MCLLFIKNACKFSPNGYRLILVSVRDEICSRPTQKCCWWPDCGDIIGGIDMFPGREGGTWLAMNKKTQRIGALLNILQPTARINDNLKSRGSLVSHFLKSDLKGKDYLEDLWRHSEEYSPFTMVTVELGNGSSPDEITCFHNDDQSKPSSVTSEIQAFGNNGMGQPWKKLQYGKEKFEEIVEKFPNYESKDQLTDALFEMLNDSTKNFPDTQLQTQAEGRGDEAAKELSAIHVCIKPFNYGSRTKSIILVSGQGQVDVIEKTMKDGCDCASPEWEYSKFNFELGA